MKPPLKFKVLSAVLCLLGMATLSYVFGAAVLFFDLPSSDFLHKAFLGGREWTQRREALSQSPARVAPPAWLSEIDQPGKTFDGFTLYARVPNSEALLIDMRRTVVHRWAIPYSQVWPKPPHLRRRVDDALTAFFGCYLYPNGDLLVEFHGEGSGLVKLDQESNVLWKYPAALHHDVDVAEDGTIYAILSERVDKLPPGLEFIPAPCLVDYVALLSPEGKILRKLSILEALRDSPYALLLTSIKGQPAQNPSPGAVAAPRLDWTNKSLDILHTNFVNVLSRKLAPKFPAFKAGQVLISMRDLDTIAVLDTESGTVVWAARGPWKGQHDPQFLDNGRLLIFDNCGIDNSSRVLEYDPRSQAFPWSYSGENGGRFYSSERGMSQRLPNGNTLIVVSDEGVFFEVSQSKEVVWSCPVGRHVTTARRYALDQVRFLKGGQRARP